MLDESTRLSAKGQKKKKRCKGRSEREKVEEAGMGNPTT